ncbi:DMT family transporter [Bacillus sp. Marseille-Q3570]|uniref:DMT family transporter n=1 Tax=Bacillus sp. Marseille-Q3570 TaxID=2963522 RepID=UPI0021B6EAF8|nr:DMT family transporter [Bacillus sp. Marseille-Q3570]
MRSILSKLQELPYLLLVIATFFWGTNFVISRLLVNEIPPLQLSFIRWSIAFLVFFPFIIKDLKQNRTIIRKNWKVLLAMALTGVAGFNTLLYIAVQYTTSINASLVNSLAPLLMVLLSVIFLKEKLFKIQYIGVILSFVGVFTVITDGHLGTLLALKVNPGDLLVFAAVVLFSIYSVLMKKFGVDLPKKTTFIVTIFIAVVSLIPFALWESSYRTISLAELPFEAILATVYLGVFPSIVSFICWNEGVMKVGPAKASNYLHLIVFFTTILAVAFADERLVVAQVIGGLFILTGVILASNPQFILKKTTSVMDR